MSQEPVLVAVYEDYAAAELAVRMLRRKRFGVHELAVVGGLAGADEVHRLCAFGAGLYDLGIPEAAVLAYENAVRAGFFLVVAHGDEGRVTRAGAHVEATAPKEWAIHRP